MATSNPSKAFAFAIEIDGIDQMLIQEITHPDVELGSVSHGGYNTSIKTAGSKKIGDAELRKLVPADAAQPDNWGMDWLMLAENGLAQQYKKDIVFKYLAPDGVTVTKRELWVGCWAKKVKPSDHKRGEQDENTIETVTLSVDNVIPL